MSYPLLQKFAGSFPPGGRLGKGVKNNRGKVGKGVNIQ